MACKSQIVAKNEVKVAAGPISNIHKCEAHQPPAHSQNTV